MATNQTETWNALEAARRELAEAGRKRREAQRIEVTARAKVDRLNQAYHKLRQAAGL